MSKKARRKTTPTPPKTPTWIWAAIAGAVLLVVGGLAVLFSSGSDSTASNFTPEVNGAPALQANQTVIDEGDVKLGATVRNVFTLKNVGDEPLEILGEPQVQLVTGC